ncbi:Uma2 family endonuclease [Rubrivirga sp.]|uniref:Uma2 family endonuclease n=1 Tax=Rubrivirga sp. TaxID=1885344 RepID=UPI003B519378
MPAVLLQPLLDSPALPHHVEALQRALRAEAESRERFRKWLTPSTKAEFINGEVVMHSPARDVHNQVVRRLVTLLGAHNDAHALGGTVAAEKALVGLTRNDYEPDVAFWGPDKTQEIGRDTKVYPAPDLVVEVLSASTSGRDRGVKREDYAAHGVAEYWIVDADDESVVVHRLGGRQYTEATAGATLASEVAAGFAIPTRALFDDAASLAALRAVVG